MYQQSSASQFVLLTKDGQCWCIEQVVVVNVEEGDHCLPAEHHPCVVTAGWQWSPSLLPRWPQPLVLYINTGHLLLEAQTDLQMTVGTLTGLGLWIFVSSAWWEGSLYCTCVSLFDPRRDCEMFLAHYCYIQHEVSNVCVVLYLSSCQLVSLLQRLVVVLCLCSHIWLCAGWRRHHSWNTCFRDCQ